MKCPACGTENEDGARFCASCGSALKPRLEVPEMPPMAEPQPMPAPVSPAAPDDDEPADGKWTDFLTESVTAKVNEVAGGTGAVKLRYGDFFREVFKHHEKGEAERIFVCGTEETTPAISEVSTKWPRPWLYSRVLVLLAAITALFAVGASTFDSFIGLAGLVVFGALAAPLAVTVFFFECNALRNISFLEVAKVFLLGGTVSLLIAMGVESVLPLDYAGMGVVASVLVAVVEEVAKALVIVFFLMQFKGRNYILSGMLVGAAVGGAFGAFETAGYALGWWSQFGLQESMSLILTRSGLALGCHVAWGAIMGGALTLASNGRDFGLEQISAPGCLIFLAACVALHFFWNFELPLFANAKGFIGVSSQQAIITAFAWIVISVLLNRGLEQVNELSGAE